MIKQAREQPDVDLTVEIVHEGRNLLALVPFSKNNINIFDPKLLGKLFTKRELSEGTVHLNRTQTPSLDPVHINLIKACFLKKLKTIEAFLDNWENIVRSLRQKCLDCHPEKADKIDDETQQTEDEHQVDNQAIAEPSASQAKLARDVSMASLTVV